MSLSSGTRRASRLPRQERVADIMKAARDVFCERGFNAAFIAEIAERAGVVEGSIYRFWPTKRDLFISVVEQWYGKVFEAYQQPLAGIQGTRNRLYFMIWRHLTVIHSDPALIRLIFDVLRSDPEYRQTSVFQLNREYTQRTLAILKDGMASGELRPKLPLRVVRDMIYGGIEHHVWSFLRGERDFSPEQVARELTDLVYQGIVATSDAAPPMIARLGTAVSRLEQLAQQVAAAGRKVDR